MNAKQKGNQANCRKLVHRWRARQRTPDVWEIG
jgi:hypothetical protein